ncbi:shikimate kinase [Candidatus Woesearchaeota archaeon]|nr:shikimate kinase [Candidatus Woesearchaeota archaeon]
MNIVLVGFRGTGKTTVGKALAKKIGMGFVDADDFIERRYGFMITELFERKGESLFRMMESDVISELSKMNSYVIAAGGGAILKYKNIKNLKRHGVMILLEADCDAVYKRIRKDDKTATRRPRLTNHDLYDEIKELMDFRAPYYHRAADFTVNTTSKPVDSVVEEIVRILTEQGYIPL